VHILIRLLLPCLGQTKHKLCQCIFLSLFFTRLPTISDTRSLTALSTLKRTSHQNNYSTQKSQRNTHTHTRHLHFLRIFFSPSRTWDIVDSHFSNIPNELVRFPSAVCFYWTCKIEGEIGTTLYGCFRPRKLYYFYFSKKTISEKKMKEEDRKIIIRGD
jgi:hypothetical protein